MYFTHYYWKNGVPQGQNTSTDSSESYKIVTDPYHKRYTVEKYLQNRFDSTVYDSQLLDFRKLNPMEKTAWQKRNH